MILLCWLRLASDVVVMCCCGFCFFCIVCALSRCCFGVVSINLCTAFFFCVVAAFFGWLITKLVLQFFCLLQFCNLHSFLVCLVRNYLFDFLLIFLFFRFTYSIPCLPYFLKWFCAFLHSFLSQNYSLLHYLIFASSSRCRLLVFIACTPSKFASFYNLVSNMYYLG